MATEKLLLLIEAISNSVKSPDFEVKVNGSAITATEEYSDTDVANKKTFKYTYDDTVKTVSVTLFNKTPNDTKIVNGEIAEDLLVVVKKMCVSGIDLTDKLSKISNYVGDNGQVYKTHGYISFNGTATFKIHKNVLYTNWLASF